MDAVVAVVTDITALSTLDPLSYASARQSSADALKIGVSALDKAVAAERAKLKAEAKAKAEAKDKVRADAAAVALTQRLSTLPKTSCALADGSIFEMLDDGLYCLSAPDAKGNSKSTWLSGKFEITHSTRSFENGEWGRVVIWTDKDGQSHSLSISMAELASTPANVWAAMSEGGLAIAPARPSRDMLATYLQVLATEKSARSVTRAGWTRQGQYVMQSGEVLGQSETDPIFYQGNVSKSEVSEGTVEDWKDSVGRLAKGNSRLMFAVCSAFASPMLTLCGEGGGGFHLRGASSTGKTSALKVAASIYGAAVNSWRATSNGLEGVASAHNDSLLILDEVNQCSPFEVGETAYMLANGVGKLRANRHGAARKSAEWRTLFLSSGEQDLESILSTVKKKIMAGMEIRMLSIPADAGAEMGLIECLHDCKTPGALAEKITDAAATARGAVGKEWLEFLADDFIHDDAKKALSKSIDRWTAELVSENEGGQVRRAARRFAVVLVAGITATALNLTGWSKDDVILAVSKCFTAWKDNFQNDGGQSREQQQIIDQVIAFIQQNSMTRFQQLHSNPGSHVAPTLIRDRAGFRRVTETGELEYLVFPDAFKNELSKGHDYKDVAKVLESNGTLKRFSDKYLTTKVVLPGLGRQRVYVLTLGTDAAEVADDEVSDDNF